jgi:hypothetical protein
MRGDLQVVGVGLADGQGQVVHDLAHLGVGQLAGLVHDLALLVAGHAAHGGGQLEAGGGGGHVDEALGGEQGGHGALQLVESLLVGGRDQAHVLLGAVVGVVDGGLQEHLIQGGLLVGDVAAVAPLAVRPAATTAATAAESLADDGALNGGEGLNQSCSRWSFNYYFSLKI